MGAEGKAKRGAAGVSNAANIAFRGNGMPPDWQARRAGCYQGGGAASSGSVTMRGLLGGIIAAKLGYEMTGNYERAIAHAQKRVTHSLLRLDEGS